MTERGRVEHGRIVFRKPLALPEGTEVMVHIEPLAEGEESPASVTEAEFSSEPFFGMWADRPEMENSAAWVRSERERWQQRGTSEG